MQIDGQEFHAALIGEVNAYNLLSVYGVSQLLVIEQLEALAALSSLSGAEGRFDYITSPKDKIVAIVDYAHTPDALEKVLATIAQVREGKAKIYAIVGCGGDRDRTKRPVMAKAAVKGSDQTIFTSDNPRTENPETIIAEMKEGIDPAEMKKTLSISDRKEAIRTAIRMAEPGDIILVAGKGHEKYQEINGVKQPFDDKQVLDDAIKEFDR
jgi:UDP-N-acetylmuramoyl-L-alanyl-D-glutamate--2,6-diaminopimelate ligase